MGLPKPKPLKAKNPGLKPAVPGGLAKRPPKHPWDPGYKASKKVVNEAKKVFDSINPFD